MGTTRKYGEDKENNKTASAKVVQTIDLGDRLPIYLTGSGKVDVSMQSGFASAAKQARHGRGRTSRLGAHLPRNQGIYLRAVVLVVRQALVNLSPR